MQYWLVKSEPETYCWEDFWREKRTAWTGVRNFAARKNLRAMQCGDEVLFYSSVTDKAVQGVAIVVREAFPDPTANGEDWSAVELKVVAPLSHPVTLDRIKSEPALSRMALLRQGRLSVSPVAESEYKTILRLAAG